MSTNASVPSPAPVSKPVQASAVASATNMSGVSSQIKEKDRINSNCIPGFIFLCNGKTKPQCFQYRVFALPMGQKKTVQKVKPGTKLFLFDYELRLLYGVYEAASEGKVNLEPTAFEGKFPAQVKFRIFKECFPLPEKSFRSAIQENYEGARFSQELTEPQVKTLVSVFRSLSSSSPNPLALSLPNEAPLQAMPPLRIEDQDKQSIRLHSLHTAEPQPLQTAQIMQHQSIPNPSYSYHAHSKELYCSSSHIQVLQDPYTRYSSVPQHHTMGWESDYHPLPLWNKPLEQGLFPPQQEHDVWYHQQLPLFRERETALSLAVYTSGPTTYNNLSNMPLQVPAYERLQPTYPVPNAYVSSTMQPHASASVWAMQPYSSSTMQPYAQASGRLEPNYLLPPASCVSSTMQPYAPASGRPEEMYALPTESYGSSTMHYPLNTGPHISTAIQPYGLSSGVPEPNVSVSFYDSFDGAYQVIR